MFPPGNVRITLDRELHTALFQPDLLETPLPCFQRGNGVLLEVKYDEFLPEMIRDLVQLGNRQAGAFSNMRPPGFRLRENRVRRRLK